MKLISTLQIMGKYFGKAMSLSLVIFLLVTAAEGLQHIIEYRLGMYQSREMFRAYQSDPLRLGFGIVKAISVFTACYFVPKALTKTYGPPPKFGSFNKDMIRKIWDPRGGLHGLIAMIICSIPLIALHFYLSKLAMGHTHAAIILVLDSLIVGVLAVVMGTSIWAGDYVDAEFDASIS